MNSFQCENHILNWMKILNDIACKLNGIELNSNFVEFQFN
jgi:hypothetical protein